MYVILRRLMLAGDIIQNVVGDIVEVVDKIDDGKNRKIITDLPIEDKDMYMDADIFCDKVCLSEEAILSGPYESIPHANHARENALEQANALQARQEEILNKIDSLQKERQMMLDTLSSNFNFDLLPERDPDITQDPVILFIMSFPNGNGKYVPPSEAPFGIGTSILINSETNQSILQLEFGGFSISEIATRLRQLLHYVYPSGASMKCNKNKIKYVGVVNNISSERFHIEFNKDDIEKRPCLVKSFNYHMHEKYFDSIEECLFAAKSLCKKNHIDWEKRER